MPQLTTCPECDKQLRVPDDLIGRKVRCPGCSAMFTAKSAEDAAPPPPPARAPAPAADNRAAFKDLGSEPPRRRDRDDDPDDRPRRRDDRDDDRRRDDRDDDRRRDRDDYSDRRRDRRDDDYDDRRRDRRDDDYDDDRDLGPRGEARALKGVRLGINLNVIGSWLILGLVAMSVLFFGLAMLIGATATLNVRGGGSAAGAAGGILVFTCLFSVLILGMALTALVLILVGMGMCIQTPKYRNSSAKGLAIAAFSCAAASVFIYLVGVGFNFLGAAAARGGGPVAPMGGCVSIFAYPIGLAGFILWLFYLRSLCFALRNREVGGKVLAVFIGYMVYIGLCVLFAILAVAVFAAALGSLFGGGQGPGSAQQVGRTIGGAFVFMMVMYGVLILVGVGMQIWYTLVLQQVRDVVDRYRVRM